MCHHVDSSGNPDERTLELAYINAAYQSGKKNSIDSAILSFVDKSENATKIDLGAKVAEIPFTFEKRRSSCVVKYPTGKLLLICKGAFEEVLVLCNHIRHGKDVLQLDSSLQRSLAKRVAGFNDEGYRVILVATKNVEARDCRDVDDLKSNDSGMTVEGLLTFLDPPKEDAAQSIKQLQDLGVDVKVITGDNIGVLLSRFAAH